MPVQYGSQLVSKKLVLHLKVKEAGEVTNDGQK